MNKEKQYICELTFKIFKQTYKEAFSGDHWSTALETWFECVGQKNKRGLPIPESHNYRPGLGSDGTEEDSYFHAFFEECSDEVLEQCDVFLTRYCHYLKFKKCDY